MAAPPGSYLRMLQAFERAAAERGMTPNQSLLVALHTIANQVRSQQLTDDMAIEAVATALQLIDAELPENMAAHVMRQLADRHNGRAQSS